MGSVNNCSTCGRFMGKGGRHRCKPLSGFKQESLLGGAWKRVSGLDSEKSHDDNSVEGLNIDENVHDYSSMHETMRKLTTEELLETEQLPMFLTPSEIIERWAPTEGDRLYWHEDGRDSPSHDETDEEFWDRKLREAKGGVARRDRFPSLADPAELDKAPTPPAPTRERPGFINTDLPSYPTATHPSLYKDLEENGVTSPVSLEPKGKAVEDGKDKPEVLGGNHRVAAMRELNPDEPIPVAFFESRSEARDSLGKGY